MSVNLGKGDKTPTSHWIHLLVFFFFVLGFGFLPPFTGVTDMGMKAIGLFCGMLYGLLFLDSLIYPSLVVLFLLVAYGFKTSGAAMTGWIGNGTIVTMIGFLALTQGIKESGAAENIAKWIITRKFIQNKPYLFTYVFLIAVFVAGIFLPPTAGMIFFMQILSSCRKVIGYDAKDPWCYWMIVGISLAACFGTYGLPFKSMCIAIMAPFLGIIGKEVNTPVFIIYTYTISIIFFALFVLLMKINKVNFKPLKDFNANEVEELQGSFRMNKQQMIIIISFFVAVLYSFIPLMLKPSPFLTWFKTWSLSIWVLFVCAILNIIRIKNKPILELGHALKEGVMWRIVALVGTMSMVSDAISNADYGVKPILENFMGRVFGGMSFPVFTLVVVAMLVVLTNFLNNQMLGIVCGTVIAPLALQYMNAGIDYNAFLVMIAFVVQCAFITPSAYATVTIFLGGETFEGDSKFLWKNGWQICIAFIIPAAIVITTFAHIF